MIVPMLTVLLLSVSDLSVDESDALFNQNAQRATTLRVEWRRTSGYTEAWRDYTVKNGLVLRRQLEAGEVLPQLRENVQKMVDASGSTVVPPARTMMQDYWSDRERFQWRVLNDNSKGFESYGPNPSRVSHPDVESTIAELTGTLKDRLIITGGGGGLPFRTWFGAKQSSNKAFYSGTISFDVPVSKGMIEFFPPLALAEQDWRGIGSKIDLFAKPAPVRVAISGQHQIGTTSTQVVVKAWPRAKNGSGSPEKAWDVIRAFVDLNRAAIPVRMEGYVVKDKDLDDLFQLPETPRSGDRSPFPTWIVRDVEIKEISSEFSYPIHGFEDELGPSPDGVGSRPSRLVPHRVIEWEAYRVQPNRPMSSEMFDLDFPPNTLYRDERSNEARLTGSVDGYSELIINRIRPESQSFSIWNLPFFWGGLGLMIATILAVWQWRARLRKQR